MILSTEITESEISALKTSRKRRTLKSKKSDAELVQFFWFAPQEAYFDQFTIALVVGRAPKTLECDRWQGRGLPFRKIRGRVLYKKSEVIGWLEGHERVTSTSEYKGGLDHD
jgi:hypothetical protein